MKSNKTHNAWLLLPLWGILIFTCLYLTATQLYPGGSQADTHAAGFSWINNYWCNLLDAYSINGQHNPARPVAITAMFVLFVSLAYFWYLLPLQVTFNKYSRLAIQVAGFTSMAIGMLLFTSLHDIIINIASFFGLIAITGTFAALNRLGWKRLTALGVCCMILIVVNNILHYGNGLRLYLPVVQKITFLFFLLWISLIDACLFLRVTIKRQVTR